MRISGGGGKSAFWRQVIADVLQKPVVTLETQEGSAYGAALLAMVGTGAYGSVPEACRSMIRETSSVMPRATESDLYQKCYTTYSSLYPALRPIFQRIVALKSA